MITKKMSCTIVTGYYEIKSKHPASKYREWMTNMLTTLKEQPVVIFCDRKHEALMYQLRSGKEHLTRVIVSPFENMYCQKYKEYWDRDWERDPEKDIHTVELYMIWSEKSTMVGRAIELNPFGTEFYCWCDIGCFRDKETVHQFTYWPSHDFVRIASREKIYLLNVSPLSSDDMVLLDNQLTKPKTEIHCTIGGTIFLAHINVWHQWIKAYYETLELYMQHDYFAGKDQTVMATVVARYPNLCKLIAPGPEGDPWFYFQFYFLSRTDFAPNELDVLSPDLSPTEML